MIHGSLSFIIIFNFPRKKTEWMSPTGNTKGIQTTRWLVNKTKVVEFNLSTSHPRNTRRGCSSLTVGRVPVKSSTGVWTTVWKPGVWCYSNCHLGFVEQELTTYGQGGEDAQWGICPKLRDSGFDPVFYCNKWIKTDLSLITPHNFHPSPKPAHRMDSVQTTMKLSWRWISTSPF